MFQLPDGAPWGAVMVVSVFGMTIVGMRALVRALWPQDSQHRKELLQEWQRERARRRREINRRE